MSSSGNEENEAGIRGVPNNFNVQRHSRRVPDIEYMLSWRSLLIKPRENDIEISEDSLETGPVISNTGKSYQVYHLPTNTILTKTVVLHPRRRIDPWADDEDDCALFVSETHLHLLTHMKMVVNNGYITAILSERSFNTLERKFLNLGVGVLPPLNDSLLWTEQLTSAVFHLHEKRIVHGQLSPQWVHFDSFDQIKLFLTPLPFFQMDRRSYYTAPELRHTDPVDILSTHDVYSLACLNYRMLEARDPDENMEGIQMRGDLIAGIRDSLQMCWSRRRPVVGLLLDALQQ